MNGANASQVDLSKQLRLVIEYYGYTSSEHDSDAKGRLLLDPAAVTSIREVPPKFGGAKEYSCIVTFGLNEKVQLKGNLEEVQWMLFEKCLDTALIKDRLELDTYTVLQKQYKRELAKKATAAAATKKTTTKRKK